MTNIVVFHSALGLHDGIHAMADTLRQAGHNVYTPDFYDGNVFTKTAAGMAYRDEVTFPELARRASGALEELPAEATASPIVFAGFSLGAAMAQSFGKRDPRAAGAILFHAGGVPTLTSWQPQVPVQVHHTVGDPFVDFNQVSLLLESVAQTGAHASHFVYPGAAHLFADPTSPDYDENLATLMFGRVIEFLAELD